MKHVVDSSGWIHYLLNGPLAERYVEYVQKPAHVLTPSIIVYEVYKTVKRSANEDLACEAIAALQDTVVVPLDSYLARSAADISLHHKLSMADAIVYATARKYSVSLYTSDADFKGLPGVDYISSEEFNPL